jgi:hypothetical protein
MSNPEGYLGEDGRLGDNGGVEVMVDASLELESPLSWWSRGSALLDLEVYRWAIKNVLLFEGLMKDL